MARSILDDFDGYRKWLGITNKGRTPTHYELLGISLDEDDPDVIRATAEQRRQFVETKRGEGHDTVVTEILYRIGEAETVLLDEEMRRDYDRQRNLFEKRRKSRQVDLPAASSHIKSTPGRTVGEEAGLIKTFIGIMVVLCLGFGVMAWLSFQLPWGRSTTETAVTPVPSEQQAVEQPPPQQVVQLPISQTEPEPSKPMEAEQPDGIQAETVKSEVPANVDAEDKEPKPLLHLSFDANQTKDVQIKLHGAKYVNGKTGKAMQFDGKSFASVDFALPIGNAPRSLSVWLKDTRGPLEKRLIHPVTQGHKSGTTFGIMQASGKWRFFDFSGGLDSGHPVDREWHHHCVTTDGTTIVYYFDGVRAAEVQRRLSTAVAPLMLGTFGEDLEPEKRFVGLIDELKVFGEALSAEQVSHVMTETE